jgi:hypothetical protein
MRRALIAADTGEIEASQVHARRALEAAASDQSGFRYHPSVGLVTEQYDGVIAKLEVLSAA